jgi:hypothetical protein
MKETSHKQAAMAMWKRGKQEKKRRRNWKEETKTQHEQHTAYL